MHVRWTRLSCGEDQYSRDTHHTLVVDLSTIFTLTRTFAFEGPSIRVFFFFSHLTVLPVSRFMRSDVKINLLVKLFSPKGKELNLFFFHTDLVLSGDESMTQVRNSKSWINDLCLAWSNMIDCLGSWLLLCIKIYVIYKWLWTEEKDWVFSKNIILCNTLNVIPSDQFNKTFFKVMNAFFLSFTLSPFFFSFLAIIQHQ